MHEHSLNLMQKHGEDDSGRAAPIERAMTTDFADAVVQRCLAGSISPAIAIAQILAGGGDVASIAAAVLRAGERLAPAHVVASEASPASLALTSPAARERLDAIRSLLQDVTPGCARIAASLRNADPTMAPAVSSDSSATSATAIDRCKTFFDDLVQQSEEASVALYSLGNPALLRQASEEVVDVLELWGTINPDTVVLDIGCGIGRLEQLLSSRVAEIYGIDVSPGMIAAAQRRTASLGNVHFQSSNGRDLGAFADGSFELVMAVDSFPYLHASGMALVEQHFREARRVLRSRGHFLILNFSYRGDPLADQHDVARLAEDSGFDVVACGTRPFTLWDGLAFHLRSRD